MKPSAIGLLTDFGVQDGYVACVKGVLIRHAPQVPLIDISHQIPPQDILAGAWVLAQAIPWFPEGSLFLAVVDPGVGSDRKMVAVQTEKYIAVAPDNGLLSIWLRSQKILSCVILEDEKFWHHPVSNTFHARDVMAPVLGFLAAGGDINKLGRTTPKLKQLAVPSVEKCENTVKGVIVMMDHFGNAITNILGSEIHTLKKPSKSALQIGNHSAPVVSSYSAGETGKLIALEGSSGYLEVAVKGGSAAALFDLKLGQQTTLIL